jgi:hypothetical protein
MSAFFSGMIAMGFLIAGLFFLRFWWRTNDTLFAVFAFAFWLFAANQTLVSALDLAREERSWIYILRLAGFALIIVAIFIKNTGRSAR